MNPFLIILAIVAVILLVAFIVLYFLGKKAEKKKLEQDEQIAATAQTATLLIIDKKRMPLKDSGLPQMVIDQVPKIARRSKLPIVKAKVGPRVMTLIADEKIFNDIPVKKEVKASISGLYITSVRGIHGPLPKQEVKKKGFRARIQSKYDTLSKEARAEKESKSKKKSKK